MSKPMTEAEWYKAMAKFDVKVEYYGNNWYSRGRPRYTGPFNDIHGVVIHHTGGNLYTDDSYTRFLFISGRRDLPAPLCHAEGRANGTIVMGAGGRANHAGLGSSRSLNAVIQETTPYSKELNPKSNDNGMDGNRHFYGIEIDYGGGSAGPTEAQLESAVNWAAAICDHYGWTGASVIGHREWTYKKPDPARINMGNFRKLVDARIAKVNRQTTDVKPAPVPTPKPVPVATVPMEYPADIVGKNWKVTTFENIHGRLIEVKQKKLATYANKFFRVGRVARFGDDPFVLLDCYHGGATTSGSDNPRNEFREMIANGLKEIFWDGTDKRYERRMFLDFVVNRATKVKPHVVLAQCHNGKDDVTTLRFEGNKKDPTIGSLYITKGDNSHFHLITNKYKVGTRANFEMLVINGIIVFKFNGKLVRDSKGKLVYVKATTNCYFKAGNYLQSNPETAPKEKNTEFARVLIFDLYSEHKKVA